LEKHRYLVDFESDEIEKEYYDVIVVGSGVAGVYTALQISKEYRVAIITKDTIETSNSVLAQGGIAVSLDKEDSPELHFKDTLYAGAGLCDENSVWVLVNEAADNIETLCELGVNFDRKNSMELSLSREGAHSMNRIIHAGDTTGKEVCDKLTSIVRGRENITIKERIFAIDVLTEGKNSKGILAFDEDSSKYKLFMSNAVICATGGFGQLYSNTSNPEVATGDGICMAYRAGAELVDLEFIQFHPTVLFHPEDKSFLISEAVRGEGAVLRNSKGERFMPKYHELEELAPRDVVSRAIFEEMHKAGTDHVFLDVTAKGKEYLEKRFPNIYKTCLNYGIDMAKDYIPVAPAEHYCMGGIRTDVYGRTNIDGLYACGESACTGIHGANRLASNSLLEGLVFGHKIAKEVSLELRSISKKVKDISISFTSNRTSSKIDESSIRSDIKATMTHEVGIVRSRESLLIAKRKIDEYISLLSNHKNENIKDFELQNIALLSELVIESALEREESRGAHYRSDFDKTDDINWKRNIIKVKHDAKA
jgi:L-aspartate oxidase